ncbi:hypothetical protein CGCVW01_v000460 [Colletotrichum viniferum]|nr:hypothetical protein CGCVW01_v000460 [Colletotrichum viniferum]
MTLVERSDLIGGEYQIKSHQVSDDFLDVYVVTNRNGTQFEAQVFTPISKIPREKEGLYQARRRRMKRIHRSSNFAAEFEHNGQIVLLSRVQRNHKEWLDLQSQAGTQPRYENLPFSTDRPILENIGTHGIVFESSVPHAYGQMTASYAEVTSRSECLDSKDPPGQRRLRLSLGS